MIIIGVIAKPVELDIIKHLAFPVVGGKNKIHLYEYRTIKIG